MKFISTRRLAQPASFHDAMYQGLAPDGGLYIPRQLVHLPEEFFKTLDKLSLVQLGDAIINNFLPEIPPADVAEIVEKALDFPIPLVQLEEKLYLLEVFHGPTLAFKDVGARFMAQSLAYFLKKDDKKLTIIVATSGDTGSAIAHAFHKIPNIEVFVLYPSKKITELQEKQMTTLGDNIHALEVEGTFDDCQTLVKSALMDDDVKAKKIVTTANSINIARLLPQVIYHSWSVAQLRQNGILDDPTLVVPSGNFGNLVAALYSRGIGFPINHFVAATNINATVPYYLETGEFKPQLSQHSYSNAMDVGNPSNFERLQALYDNNYKKMRHDMMGISISDEQTVEEIREVYKTSSYIMDPHTAVGVAAAKEFRKKEPANTDPLIVTSTAHPAKFPEVIKLALGKDIDLPEVLKEALGKTKQARLITPNYEDFKQFLLNQ